MLGRAPQATVAAQGEQQLPLRVRALGQDLVGIQTTNKVIPGPVGHYRRPFHFGEWILSDQLAAQGIAKELLGDTAPTAASIVAQPLPSLLRILFVLWLQQPAAPVARFARGDFIEWLRCAKIIDEAAFGVAINGCGPAFDVRSADDVAGQELAERSLLGRLFLRRQSKVSELRVQLVVRCIDLFKPSLRFIVRRSATAVRLEQLLHVTFDQVDGPLAGFTKAQGLALAVQAGELHRFIAALVG